MGSELFLLASDAASQSAELADKAGSVAPGLPLILGLTVFVLAIFVGFEIITKIPPTLHTPLMSGSNAISGITLVGSLVAAGSGFATLFSSDAMISVLGLLAVVFATINVVGGFVVTDRMLGMFKRKD